MTEPYVDLLTPGEVATIFRVDPKTVTRWANEGKFRPVWTPGGHRRFRNDEVQRLYRAPRPSKETQT